MASGRVPKTVMTRRERLTMTPTNHDRLRTGLAARAAQVANQTDQPFSWRYRKEAPSTVRFAYGEPLPWTCAAAYEFPSGSSRRQRQKGRTSDCNNH